MKSGLAIRFAEKKDISLILDFIKSLAMHVDHIDDVVSNEEMLTENLFNKRYAEVIIAEVDSKPAGFAIFFHNFSTFLGKPGIYLEDLFVNEEYRGKGYGKEILSFIAKLAVDRGCGRFEWSVLDRDEKAVRFYKSLGAWPVDETTVYRLDDSKLISLALY